MKQAMLVILSVSLSIISDNAYGQPPVIGEANTFQYSLTGHRVKREHQTGIQINRESPSDTSQLDKAAEQLLMKAYPNPTNDFVTVENLSWKDKDRADVKLFDITGKLITSKEFTQGKDIISFRGIAPGTYQLHYYLHGKLTSWKVVKQ